MSEMVERVANAMMQADWADEGRPIPDDVSIKNYYRMARAAIEAMRSPTEEMLSASQDFRSYTDGYGSGRGHYEVMIGAALQANEVSGSNSK